MKWVFGVPLWLSDFALSLPRSPGVPPFMHVPLQAAFSSPLGSAERNLSQQYSINIMAYGKFSFCMDGLSCHVENRLERLITPSAWI